MTWTTVAQLAVLIIVFSVVIVFPTLEAWKERAAPPSEDEPGDWAPPTARPGSAA